MKILLIVDIDNTLAENEHRVNLLPNWEAFFKACDKDTSIEPIIDCVKPYLKHELIDTIFVTGRTGYSEVKSKTKAWLLERNINNPIVHYRPLKDFTKAPIFKQKVLEKERTSEHHKIIIIDDDKKIIDHFESLGHFGILVTKDNDYKDTAKAINEQLTDLIDFIVLEKSKKTVENNIHLTP